MKVILRFDTSEGKYELECAMKGMSMNHAIDDALNVIRRRLKYESDDVTPTEEKVLEEIRNILNEAKVDDCA